MLTIAKFGGTSLADGAAFRAVRELITADPARKGIVVSAPGRRFSGDPKVTDLLLACWTARENGKDWLPVWRAAAARFREICRDLGVFPEIEGELTSIEERVHRGAPRDWLLSRGEYLTALILARLLGRDFIDSLRWLRFDNTGRLDTVRSYGLLRSLAQEPFVTPGFYGAMPDGTARTFPRGGSDITGALVAAALEADLYENWTDVPGVLQADPRLIPGAKSVEYLTYAELAELTAVGTQVLHEGAVQPVRDAGIPLSIRCTFRPQAPGTLILPQLPSDINRCTVLCLAGLRDRTLLCLEDARPGVLAALLQNAGLQTDFRTEALGLQTASIPSEDLDAAMEALGPHLCKVALHDSVALVAVIIAREETRGPLGADILAAVRHAGIPLYTVLRPFGGHTLLLAVPDSDYLKTLEALHQCAAQQGQQN